MRVLFAGGGTAGHITPALAIAERLTEENANNVTALVGREGGDENRAVISRGMKLYTLKVRGFSRKDLFGNFKTLSLTVKALGEAKKIINDFLPDIIVGTGGYVCWPILKAGMKMGIPCVIHESNIYPGLVTRLMAKRLNLTLLSAEESLKFIPKIKRWKVVGTPVSSEFFKKTRAEARKELGIKNGELFILSFGGSLGSERLNEAVIDMMNTYSEKSRNIKHVHSIGRRYFDEISKDYPDLVSGKGGCKIRPYIDNMPTHILASDIVICRAGAMTISEVCAAGAVSVLVPSPNVKDNHQFKNASALSEGGAAVLLEEKDLKNELENTVKGLLGSAKRRYEISECARKFCKPDTQKAICEELKNTVKEKRGEK